MAAFWVGVYFHEIWYNDGWFSVTDPMRRKFVKLALFLGILPKKHPICPHWVFFAENGILKGPKIVAFIGIVNGDVLEAGRHISVQNVGEYIKLRQNKHMAMLTCMKYAIYQK